MHSVIVGDHGREKNKQVMLQVTEKENKPQGQQRRNDYDFGCNNQVSSTASKSQGKIRNFILTTSVWQTSTDKTTLIA